MTAFRHCPAAHHLTPESHRFTCQPYEKVYISSCLYQVPLHQVWKAWKKSCAQNFFLASAICLLMKFSPVSTSPFYMEFYHTARSSQWVYQNLWCYSTVVLAFTEHVARGSPLSSTGPKMAKLSLTVVQFHLLPRNWCWHSWIPIFTPSATLGMIST